MLTGVFILKVRTIIPKAENNPYPSEKYEFVSWEGLSHI
jgi:hypothetical protein